MFASVRRFLSVLACFVVFSGGFQHALSAQSARAVAASARITAQVDPGQVVRLQNHVPSWAAASNDQGALDTGRQLTNLHLILTRAPQVETAFQQLLADQQDPASPRYHQWLTPEQNAEQFGIAPADLAAVTSWLQSQGLSVDDVAVGGVFITFSGPVANIQNAFSTSLHNFTHEGTLRYAATVDPAIPAAFSGMINSVAGLSEEVRHIHSRKTPVDSNFKAVSSSIHPATSYNSNQSHYLAPGDFNIIYDVASALSSGINGSGYRVAVIISSRIVASDITNYENLFGLSAGQPTQILVPGNTDPGTSDTSSEGEADLDVQRVLGTAPGAGVDVLVINSLADNNIFSALQYETKTINDASVNMSFGGCNTTSGSNEAAQYDSYYQAAAVQGISIFNSSGDNGAAGCDANYSTLPSPQVQAANILCMSGYVTCVGGTEFLNSSSYWSASNSATGVSAQSYIPEGGWNEPSYVNSKNQTVYQAAGSGGGPGYLAKPSWQTGTGVPADGLRDTPDVSFTASDQNGFLICEADSGAGCTSLSDFTYVIGGTSASSPSMAAVATLLDQKLGARQGNLNPLLYQLAAATSSPFHDATILTSGVINCTVTTPSMCNNSTPSSNSLSGGLSGYLLQTGYDEVTGLGSLDVNNFLTAASMSTLTNASPTFTLASSPTQLTVTGGAISGNTATITLRSSNGFGGVVSLACSAAISSGTATSTPTCSLSAASATLTSGGGATVIATITSTASATTGCTSLNSFPSAPWLRSPLLAMLAVVILPFRRRKAVRNVLAICLLACGLTWLTGCGGGGHAPIATPCTVLTTGTTKGTYTVTVTGTSGSATASTRFDALIQ